MIPCTEFIRLVLPGSDLLVILSNEKNNSFLGDCNCLPACTSVSYETSVDRAKSDSKVVEMDNDEGNRSK